MDNTGNAIRTSVIIEVKPKDNGIMPRKINSWQPRYTITSTIAKSLMEIEAARVAVEYSPLPPAVENELRQKARIRSSHFSTFIEGNRLTLSEVSVVIEDEKIALKEKEKDVLEARNYWNALLRIEEWAEKKSPLNEELICKLHAIIEKGLRVRPTPYRDGQNVIRDSATGAIVYLPPEAKDVPTLMAEMLTWFQLAERENIPIPLIAALIHYQLVTIHPYYDGNGRTARQLATFILHRGGYGLNGYFSLEEHHARDLSGYYEALATHAHHNYYMGRASADLTGWVEYFTTLLARVFTEAKDEAVKLAGEALTPEPKELRSLDHRARIVLGLFTNKEAINTSEIAVALGLSQRMARELVRNWVKDGWLIPKNSFRNRQYILSAIYRHFVGN